MVMGFFRLEEFVENRAEDGNSQVSKCDNGQTELTCGE